MNAYSQLKWYFFALRNPILSKLIRMKPVWRIIPKTPDNVKMLIALVVGQLCISKNPRYSNTLLQILRAVPKDELDADETAIGYFVTSLSLASTAHESVVLCQNVFTLCFNAGALIQR
jgi:hypothetical protein